MNKNDLQDISDLRFIQIVCFTMLLIMLGLSFYILGNSSKKGTNVIIVTIFAGFIGIGFFTGIIALAESTIHEYQNKAIHAKQLSECTELTILAVIYFIILLPAFLLLADNLALCIGLAVLGGVATPAFIIMLAEIIDVSHEHSAKKAHQR